MQFSLKKSILTSSPREISTRDSSKNELNSTSIDEVVLCQEFHWSASGVMVFVEEITKKDSKGSKTTVEVWQVGCL